MAETRELKMTVPVLARVEGEGALDLDFEDGRVTGVRLRIFEPPRFFEKLLEGRHYDEVPDMVARICGICPVAYQMSAVHALESIFRTEPGPWVREMRRLLYCGEWLESQSLHIHLLAAPDFLGFPNAIAMAGQYRDEVKRGLELQALGNEIIRLLGGRSVHPVGVCVGGFYHAPSVADVSRLRSRLHDALPMAEELVQWTASLALPHSAQDFITVSLRHPGEYPLNEGAVAGSDGLHLPIDAYEELFEESHVAHSTALYSHYRGRPYLVGPLARLNLNLDRLPASVRGNLERTGVPFPSRNLYHSIVARAVEIHYALVEALRILDNYRIPEATRAPVTPRAGVGFGCTEAPRGMLWQRWETNARGEIVSARIVPPTSQNQARIEEDLRLHVEALGVDSPEEVLRQRCETVVRNYDPCISCATHFLKLKVHRA
ncbi:MAG: Ni/Fe hydrogenase subunit alpha [Rhodocyclaceae bacterium]|nr:Ni/Fe hydrogenase subunit alpha [Rhodocyclaceae bacterium]